MEGEIPASQRVFARSGKTAHTCSNSYLGVIEVSFARRLRTPYRIVQRVLGVGVLSLPTYFNLCSFFLNTPNCRSYSRGRLIFISRKGGSSDLWSWTFSCFVAGGGFSPFSYLRSKLVVIAQHAVHFMLKLILPFSYLLCTFLTLKHH